MPTTADAQSQPLERLLEAYLVSLREDRGFARTTVTNYGTNDRRFVRFLIETGVPDPELQDFSRATVKAFLHKRASLKLRPRSTRLQIASLKAFGQWLVDRGHVDENPVDGIKPPKLDSPRQDNVTDGETLLLMAACDRIHGKQRAALARAIISMFAYAGLRRTELLNLKMGDLSLCDNRITVVHGKGGKTRIVYPHRDCLIALRQWLALRPTNCEHEYVFALDKKRRVFHSALTTLFRQVKTAAGLEDADNVHPHAMRRGCATRLLRQGYTIYDVRTFLGHEDIATTQIYLAADEQRLKGLADKGGISSVATERHVVKEKARGNRADFTRRRRTPSR